MVVKFLEVDRKADFTFNFRRSSIFPNSDMAELTPSAWDVLMNPQGGLSQMADNVNLPLSDLYEKELLDKANIISVDFIRGTRIVELALQRNNELPKW